MRLQQGVAVGAAARGEGGGGEVWSTPSLPHEFHSADFSDAAATIDIDSPGLHLSEGIQAHVKTAQQEGNAAFFSGLCGFRGNAKVTVTFFRFGKGPPRRFTQAVTWTSDAALGEECFTQAELTEEGWLTPDNKICVLVTLHLKSDAALMALVQPTIEAHPHITAQWSSPPCAYSRVLLSEQLREEKVVEGEMWSTHHMAHEFCSPDFADGDAILGVNSPTVDLCKGLHVDVVVSLYGFRGVAECVVMALRFGRGTPKQFSETATWDNDDVSGHLFLTQPQLVDEGWLTPDNKIRLLLTLHLRTNEEQVSLVQPTIEAHLHILAKWSSPPGAYSRVVLS